MARIRGSNTQPELLLRSELWRRGHRYRLNRRVLGCRPDLVFLGGRLVVFVDGCFWHGCPEDYSRPGTRPDYWAAKLLENLERDRRQTRELEDEGWSVVRIWEHEVYESPERVADRVTDVLEGRTPEHGPDWRVASVEVVDPVERIERRRLTDLRNRDLVLETVGPRVVQRSRKQLGRTASARR
jgi:DNA mismatch endonuclease, patch repair protein